MAHRIANVRVWRPEPDGPHSAAVVATWWRSSHVRTSVATKPVPLSRTIAGSGSAQRTTHISVIVGNIRCVTNGTPRIRQRSRIVQRLWAALVTESTWNLWRRRRWRWNLWWRLCWRRGICGAAARAIGAGEHCLQVAAGHRGIVPPYQTGHPSASCATISMGGAEERDKQPRKLEELSNVIGLHQNHRTREEEPNRGPRRPRCR